MEIVNFDKRTYDMMMARFKDFTARVEQICNSTQDRELGEWLDNQELCHALSISKRTLQTLRDCGSLPHSMVNHKVYYRASDVEKFINNHKVKSR